MDEKPLFSRRSSGRKASRLTAMSLLHFVELNMVSGSFAVIPAGENHGRYVRCDEDGRRITVTGFPI
jgi:hypothetical protein